ncbi:MAG: DEAD/DEAH box helicase [Candidatus Micrarchaeaceae archaeon]
MDLYRAFLDRYKSYTDIQEAAMPVVAKGENCIISAPTGAGKTEAAALPLIDMASRLGKEGIKILYITPLRALNRDMVYRLEWLCGIAGISVGVRHSDTTAKEKAKQTRNAPAVLVTTPETLQSMLPAKSFRGALKNVKAVVIDEVHELYYSKRGAQLSVGLERLEELAPGFQRIGLSATISDLDAAKRFLCGKRSCIAVEASYSKNTEISIETPDSYDKKLEPMIGEFGLDKKALARLSAIAEHIRSSKSTLIFANTRQVVEAVGSRLIHIESLDPFGGIGVHHSSLDRDERIRMEQNFKSGKLKALIATSSLELGIDIGNIDLVIQYGSPKQALRLMQRVGRSGHTRAGVSKGIILPTSSVDALESLAIMKNASDKKFERLKPNKKALDVLANQVCGIALDKGQASVDDIYRIIGRSYAYEDFGVDELKGLLAFMGRQKMIGFDGATVTSGMRTRMYYYKHLSVIPDTKRFLVKDIIDNRIIASLDEKFVASNIDEGSIFITKGLPWKVVSIDEATISVEPSADMEAAVPDWSGEDIPVSRNVVIEAFRLLASHKDAHGIIPGQEDYFMPSDSSLFIEELGNSCALYTGLGSQANEALSMLISYVLRARFNIAATVRPSPYMVLVEASIQNVISVLKSIEQRNLATLLGEALSGSELFRYRFIIIAKLFGIIEKDAAVSKSIANRIIKVLSGTPVYNEAMRELIENYFDLDALGDFIEKLRLSSIKIEVVRKNKMSPFTDSIVNSAYYARELVAPQMPGNTLVNSFADSIMGKDMKFICTYCGFSFTRKLSEIKDSAIECPSCGSPMIAPYNDSFAAVMKAKLSRKRLGSSDAKALGEMLKYADLISSYGGRAAVALSVYGVGLRTASRVLMMLKHEERSFFLDLIDAQKNFVRTKKYWSV